ncbi:hypothetical protein [Roseinatronobacter sp. S2]|uniref:hypothetical protein n=1 Tax=Roseinatronobacter sp. S2 TaxID=3035471 RepID=UPI0024104C93|nr:hypothetical protein [Roseinatronobacter sp. S2]WFE76545.1 hypothetical protein P8S53_18670 [Roseinatronobacter sp. S2]
MANRSPQCCVDRGRFNNELAIASGAEDLTTISVQQMTGQQPTSFQTFADRVMDKWM